MKKIIVILSVFIFLGIIPKAFCADVAKIGVFNFQKILTDSSAGKMIQKEINAKGNELQKKLQTEKDLLDEMNKAIEREALVLSPEKQNEKQREFRIKVNDFKKMQEDFAKEFKELEVKFINKIQKEVFEITNEIGKEEGYLLILERKVAGVVYHPAQLDITDQIIKKYNLQVSKTK
ncbi:MAG: OmpH family outer membrane protein [Deltaproteobacteria bacterium]|uniref:OmpH family outer membrane protein n=1 Tax=Desulfobacula sp. TaxID=2593537 RepID=UPI00199FDF67|nr:OmpH family outer membrane protein [Candidatus Desulfobacula maris]MBL6993707.1 OmpH family outer membrane protein [Desulfobacula sp.]